MEAVINPSGKEMFSKVRNKINFITILVKKAGRHTAEKFMIF